METPLLESNGIRYEVSTEFINESVFLTDTLNFRQQSGVENVNNDVIQIPEEFSPD